MIIEKTELSEKLKNLKSVSSPKLSDTNVQGVLFRDGCLIANNQMIAMRVVLFEEPAEETFVIPLDAIAFIEKLPSEEVEVTCGNNNEVKVKCGKIKGRFPSIAPELFPETSTENIVEGADVRLAAKDIEKKVNQIMYACPTSASKPIFQGILFDGKGKNINLVACDGYRVSVNQLSTTQKIYVVIPKEAMQKALSVINPDSDFLIKDGKTEVILHTGEYTIYAKNLSGEYIDYKAAFPKESAATFYVDKKDLVD